MAVNVLALLQTLVQNGGSDLHISTSTEPMLRIRGEMHRVTMPALQAEDVNGIVTQMMGKSKIEDLKKEKNVDFSFTAKGVGTFRVNVFYQRHGLSLVCRVLPESPPTLEELALPPVMHSTIGYPNGLVLVTGPTGSGKSTTLAAMINGINRTKKGHILTLEDPIEFVHESDQCMVNQRSLGDHFTSFASALRAGLREDPDVILVGEMRDLETVKLALEAAETGHLVFGTLHTNSAAKSIDRIINVFPSEDQNQIRISLSESVRMIISQKLIRSKDGSKRLCFHDILINNHAVANLIREQKTVQILSAMQTGRAQGMQLMDHVLADAVAQGLVDGRTAWEAANDKTKFKQYEPKELTNLNKRPKVAA